MIVKELWLCSRCHLQFVWDGIPGECPKCKRQSQVTKDPIILAGRDVKVAALKLYGVATGLLDKEIRRGMESLDLGERCPHGMIADVLCSDCATTS